MYTSDHVLKSRDFSPSVDEKQESTTGWNTRTSFGSKIAITKSTFNYRSEEEQPYVPWLHRKLTGNMKTTTVVRWRRNRRFRFKLNFTLLHLNSFSQLPRSCKRIFSRSPFIFFTTTSLRGCPVFFSYWVLISARSVWKWVKSRRSNQEFSVLFFIHFL